MANDIYRLIELLQRAKKRAVERNEEMMAAIVGRRVP